MTTTPLFTGATRLYHDVHAEWADYVEQLFLTAEAATRGHLLNRRGREAGIDPRTLFYVRAARAYAYASDELQAHWLTHPRMPWRTYEAQARSRTFDCPTCGGASSN